MGGALLQLVSCESSENIWINGQPQITFFKKIFRRHTEFAKENISVPFNGLFGSRVTVEIPAYGDLAYQIVLALDIPELDAIYPRSKLEDLLSAVQQLQLPEYYRQNFIETLKISDISAFLNSIDNSILQTKKVLENIHLAQKNLESIEIRAEDLLEGNIFNKEFKFEIYDSVLEGNSLYDLIKLMYFTHEQILSTKLIPDDIPLDIFVKNQFREQGYYIGSSSREQDNCSFGIIGSSTGEQDKPNILETYNAALKILSMLKSSHPIIFSNQSISNKSKKTFINFVINYDNLTESWEKTSLSNPLVKQYMQASKNLFDNLEASWSAVLTSKNSENLLQAAQSNLYSYLHKTPILNTILLHFFANINKMPNVNSLHPIIKKNIEFLMDELSYLMNNLYANENPGSPTIIYYRGIFPHIFDIFKWIDSIIDLVDEQYVQKLDQNFSDDFLDKFFDIAQAKNQLKNFYSDILEQFMSNTPSILIPNKNLLQMFFDIESAYVFEMSNFLESLFDAFEFNNELKQIAESISTNTYFLEPTFRFYGQSYLNTPYYSRLHQTIIPAPHLMPDIAFLNRTPSYAVPNEFVKFLSSAEKETTFSKIRTPNEFIQNVNHLRSQQKISPLLNIRHNLFNENRIIFPKYINSALVDNPTRSQSQLIEQIDKLNEFIKNSSDLNPIDYLMLLRDRYLLQKIFSDNLNSDLQSQSGFKNCSAGFMLLSLLAQMKKINHIAPLIFLYPEFSLEETLKLSQIYAGLDVFEKKIFNMFTSIFNPGSAPKFTKADVLNLVTYTYDAIFDLEDDQLSMKFINSEYQSFAKELVEQQIHKADETYDFSLDKIEATTIGEFLLKLIEQLWISQLQSNPTEFNIFEKNPLQSAALKVRSDLENLLDLQNTVATILTRGPKPKSAWVHHLAHFLIEEVTFENISSTTTSSYFETNYELNIGLDQKQSYDQMIGEIPELTTFDSNVKPQTRIYLPLIFYFNQNPGSALPLVSLQNISLRLNIKFRNLSEVSYIDDFSKLVGNPELEKSTLDIEYIYLGKDERKRFLSDNLEYLITDVQTYTTNISSKQQTLNLNNFTNPTRFMTFTVQPELHINPQLRNNVVDYWKYFPGERQYTNNNLYSTYDLSLIRTSVMRSFKNLQEMLNDELAQVENDPPIHKIPYLFNNLDILNIDYGMFDENIYCVMLNKLADLVGFPVEFPLKSYSRSNLKLFLQNFSSEVDLVINTYNQLINSVLANLLSKVIGSRNYSFARSVDYFYNLYLLKELDEDVLVDSELTLIKALVQVYNAMHNSSTNISRQKFFNKNMQLSHVNTNTNLNFSFANLQINSDSYEIIFTMGNINFAHNSVNKLKAELVESFDPKIDYVGLLVLNPVIPTLNKAQLLMNSRSITEVEGPVYWNAVTTYRKFKSTPSMGFYTYAWLLNNKISNPSGSVNLSKIDKFELDLSLSLTNADSIVVKIHTQSYGLVRCALGLCGRIF
jgi:hypothetical protein